MGIADTAFERDAGERTTSYDGIGLRGSWMTVIFNTPPTAIREVIGCCFSHQPKGKVFFCCVAIAPTTAGFLSRDDAEPVFSDSV